MSVGRQCIRVHYQSKYFSPNIEKDVETTGLLDYFKDDEVKEVIKRAVDDLEIDTSLYRVAKWIPSKPEKVEKRSLEEEVPLTDEEESIPVPSKHRRPKILDSVIIDAGSIFNYFTLRITSTTVTTYMSETTLGTAAITGNTSQCDSTSITDYVKQCG